MANGFALAGAFAQKRQREHVLVAVGVLAGDDQRMLVFVALRRVLRHKRILQSAARRAVAALHLAVQRHDDVRGSHLRDQSAVLLFAPCGHGQGDVRSVHDLLAVGQIRLDLDGPVAAQLIGDVDFEGIPFSCLGFCRYGEGILALAAVRVYQKLDLAGLGGAERLCLAAAGLITGNVADLDAAGRVAAGQRQRIGKNAVRYLVAVDRLRGLALSIRAADRGLHSVQQRIAQFKAHVAGIAENIGKRQVFETSVAFLIAGLHGQGIFDRRGAVRDAQDGAAVRDGKRLRRAALCGKAGGGDGHLRRIPAIRLELVAEFAELQLGAADLGGGSVAGLADDTLRLGAVFHPDEVQAEVLLLPPLQKEGERQLPGPAAARYLGKHGNGIGVFPVRAALQRERAAICVQHPALSVCGAVCNGKELCILGALPAQTEAVAQKIFFQLVVSDRARGPASGLAAQAGRTAACKRP